MNRRMVFYLIGQMLKVEAALMALPLIVSLIYHESNYLAFLISIGIALGLGFLMTILARPKTRIFYAKEGFVIVSMAWIAMSLIGAAPFVISGEIPSFVDALFETVSGFTTTGATILSDVEALSRGMLFWRNSLICITLTRMVIRFVLTLSTELLWAATKEHLHG